MTAVAVPMVIAVAETIRNVILEIANAQVHIPIIAIVVIGNLTNIAQTAVILQQEGVTAVQAAALVEVVQQSAIPVNMSATVTTLIIVQVVIGNMTNTAQTVAIILRENAKLVPVEEVLEVVHQNVLTDNTNAKGIPYTNAKVAIGSMKNSAGAVATRQQENAIQSVQTVNISVPALLRIGAAAENGSWIKNVSIVELPATMQQENVEQKTRFRRAHPN